MPATAPLAAPIHPTEGTAGAVQTAFGRWFADLGAVGGGEVTAAHTLLLRFSSNTDALLARAALSPVVDGVRVVIRTQNGAAPVGPAPAAGAIADFFQVARTKS